VIATSTSLEWAKSWLPLLPLAPISGHAVATDPLPPILHSCIQAEQMIVQLRTGEVVVGGDTRSETGMESDSELIRIARDLIPGLKGVRFPYAWHGIRITTPDGWSIADRFNGAANVWLRVGHFRHGLLLAPILGQLLAQSIQADSTAAELFPFRVDRFAV
jgi:glycine oxidase